MRSKWNTLSETRLRCGLLAMMCVTAATRIVAQGPTSSVVGRIVDQEGRPIGFASVSMVEVITSRHHTLSDSNGRFALRGIQPGGAHFRVEAFGFESRDTIVELVAADSALWNVALAQAEWKRKEVEARAAAAAAGGVDSFAEAGLRTDTTLGFSYASFGVALLRAAVAHGGLDSNRILSPLGAGQALGLALLAARDSTELAMRQALGAGNLAAMSLANRNHMMTEHLRTRSDLVLKLANAVWVDTSETLQPEFERIAAHEYGAAVREIPLKLPEAVALVNRWADSTTSGRITSVRQKPFPDTISVVLANAVYLKSTWLRPFDPKQSKDRPFTLSGKRRSLPTMESTSILGYRRGKNYQAVRLPYKAGLTALYLVLPDSGRSALEVLDFMTASGWPLPNGRDDGKQVHLVLPRVHVEQATDLIPPLTALGMGVAFDDKRADFSGLVQPRADRPPECPPLSQVGTRAGLNCTVHLITGASQSVYFDMNEEGTEAAAVTMVELSATTSLPPPPIQFVVDRPFLFMMRDERTGASLFVGYVADPSSAQRASASRRVN